MVTMIGVLFAAMLFFKSRSLKVQIK